MDFVVVNSLFVEDDIRLFGLTNPVRLPESASMLDVLVAAKIFKSKGDARKNWKGSLDIPCGLNRFEIGKMKTEVFILRAVDGCVDTVDHGKVGGGPTETPRPPKPKELVYQQPVNATDQLVAASGKVFFRTWPNRINFEKGFRVELDKYFVSQGRVEVVRYVGWEFRGFDWLRWGIKNVQRNGRSSLHCLWPWEWVNKYEILWHYKDLGKGSLRMWVDLKDLFDMSLV